MTEKGMPSLKSGGIKSLSKYFENIFTISTAKELLPLTTF